MPYTIKHSFVSTLADGTVATKVKPSNWNDAHAITGSLGGNEITNIPAGVVTATDVQSAINELASLIPAVGPGTDPLSLTQGLTVSVINPTNGPPSDRYGARFSVVTDVSTVQPDFCDVSTIELFMRLMNGQANYNANTLVKETVIGLSCIGTYYGSGQKFLQNNYMLSYGMSDCGLTGGQILQFAGGNVNGDEGQGWAMISTLKQQEYLSLATIVSVPAPSAVNTTTTQIITRNKDPQTVTVVSTAGAVNGDWVVVEQEIPTSGQNEEPVQIISFTPTSITGIFRCNHPSGVTITPALRLVLNTVGEMGQDRTLVNLSQPAYTTGTVASAVGDIMTGSGTTWADNMVGGYTTNIGAISLTADDYSGIPFNGVGVNGTLKSWYQIKAVTSPTSLTFFTTSVAGDGAYRGKGAAGSAYTIRPAVKILRMISVGENFTNELICDTSTSTWSIGDTVECVICPWADVTGFQYNMELWTNGLTPRGFLTVRNSGARKIGSCFFVWSLGPIPDGAPGADTASWGSVYAADCLCDFGLDIRAKAFGAAIVLGSAIDGGAGVTDVGGRISWNKANPSTSWMGFSTPNVGLELQTSNTGGSPRNNGRLSFISPNQGGGWNPSGSLSVLEWNGWMHLPAQAFNPSYIYVDLDSDLINYSRSFWRWNSNVLEIGTEKGGAGIASDFVLKTNNTEQIRLISGANVKFTAATNFSANGSVATALTSVGPAGASTTVQKWLTIVDDTNATRYIPCF